MQMRKLNQILILVVAALAGCLAFAEQPPPQSPVTKELTLDQAVQIALKQNPEILKALQEIQRTRGLVIEVRAQALPRLLSTGNYNQQDRGLFRDSTGGGTSAASSTASKASTASTTGTAAENAASNNQASAAAQQAQSAIGRLDKNWQVTIEGRQLLYSGGQVAAAMRAAKFTQDSSYWSLRDTIDTVIAKTRLGFYQVLLNRALITVREESVQLLQSQLDDQQSRYEAGTVPRFNVLQAEVALANARPALISARNDYFIAQLALAQILGLGANKEQPGKPPVTAIGELSVEPREIDVARALATAHAQRPFLKVQRLAILTQAEDVKVQLGGYQPRLEANGGYEWRNSHASSDLTEVVNGWFFGATASWSIFDGAATYGKVKQARAKLESAKVNYDDSVNQVDLEVQRAIAKLWEAKETLASQQKTVEQALESVRLSRERFSAGAGTQLDVLNAQVQLTTARSTELQARRDYNVAVAEYERVTATATRYAETFDDPLTRKNKPVTPPKKAAKNPNHSS